MKLGFEESQSSYTSGSQNARAWTEAWVSAWAYCPHCGNAKMSQFPNNSPLADSHRARPMPVGAVVEIHMLPRESSNRRKTCEAASPSFVVYTLSGRAALTAEK